MCIAVLFSYVILHIWTKVSDIPFYMDQHKFPNANLLQFNPLLLADWFNTALLSVIVFRCIRAHNHQPHNEPHSSHRSRTHLCANCSCNHSHVNCCTELHSTICVRIVSILQENTRTLKRRQTDEHMNESASV